MRHADVPTAEFRVFDHPDPARTYIESREYPVVVKADGLAAGKGVIVCSTQEEALAAVERIMVREEFGRRPAGRSSSRSGSKGEELSILALVSGRTIIPLAADAGPQGGLRRRHRPEHRRHGRLLPRPAGTPDLLEEIDATCWCRRSTP